MSIHYWGDPSFNWYALDQACGYIGEGLRRWGRVDVRQWKEKFGQCRVYCGFGLFSIQQLAYPGYVSNQWPEWLWHLEFTWPVKALRRVLNLLFVPYHRWLYVRYYKSAVRQWPFLADEILDAADWYEMLEHVKWDVLRRVL